jgi:2-dehydropantoate 2-reductase
MADHARDDPTRRIRRLPNDHPPMKVLVIGAGAIGGLLAARFAIAGHAVSAVARGPHLAAMRDAGLRLESDRGVEVAKLAVSDDPAAFGSQDAVFLTLKAYSIAAMLPRLAPVLGVETPVVTAINGLPWWYFQRVGGGDEGRTLACLDPEGAMARALDACHLVGCVVHAAAEVVAPGVIRHTGGRGFILGELDGALSPRLEALAALLRGAGLEPTLSSGIRDDIWTKLIGNLSYNPVAALTGARMDEINANPALIGLIRTMMEEAMAVGQAYGARFTVTLEERLAMARRLGAARISMLQDLERGRPLETDAIVGAVVELAQRKAIEAPMTEAVLALLRERARHASANP